MGLFKHSGKKKKTGDVTDAGLTHTQATNKKGGEHAAWEKQ